MLGYDGGVADSCFRQSLLHLQGSSFVTVQTHLEACLPASTFAQPSARAWDHPARTPDVGNGLPQTRTETQQENCPVCVGPRVRALFNAKLCASTNALCHELEGRTRSASRYTLQSSFISFSFATQLDMNMKLKSFKWVGALTAEAEIKSRA